MSNNYTNNIQMLKSKVECLRNKGITAYIHCSKLNDCWLALKQIPGLLDQFNPKSVNTRLVSSIDHAFYSLLSVINQLEELFLQCSKDTCVNFLLSTSVSAPRLEVASLRDAAVSAFRQLDIQQGVEIFTLSDDDLQLQDQVDLKRISQILVQLSLKEREDLKSNLTDRFKSLKRLGIPVSKNDATDIALPELPSIYRNVMKHDDIQLGRPIGNGQSGSVQLGTIKKTHEVVAVKILHKRSLTAPELEAYKREIYSLSVLQFPTLIEFKGYTEESPFYLVTEYMENGSLFDVLRRKPDKLTPTKRSLIAYDVARGIEYLHERKIIHRDLKSLNILLNSNYQAKICDFGMVRTMGQSPMTGMIGTAHWMAPEVLMSIPYYNEKVDVYSFAILLWELLTGNMPYKDMSYTNITIGVIHGTLRPPLPKDGPPKLIELIQKCWNQDPTKRPSMTRVVSYLKNSRYHFPDTDEEEFNNNIESTTKKKRHRTKAEIQIEPERLVQLLSNPNQQEIPEQDLFNALGETLLKRNTASAFAKLNGNELLVGMINKGDENSEMILKRLSQCKSKTIFDVDVMKALLNCSNSPDKQIRKRAIQALINASELRFHFVSTAPSFVLQLLTFLRYDTEVTVSQSLLLLSQRLLSSVQSLPEGIIELLFDIRKKADQQWIQSVNECILLSMRFPSTKNEFTRAMFESLFQTFDSSYDVLAAYADGAEPHQLDQIFLTLLKDLKRTPIVLKFFHTIASNPRFSNHIIRMILPFNQNPASIASIYSALLSCVDPDPHIIESIEFYHVAAYLIEHHQIEEVCNAFKVFTLNPTFLMQTRVCAALAEEFMNETDVTNQIWLMAAIFSTEKVCNISGYRTILPKLSSLLVGENQQLAMPAFLCVAGLAFYGKDGINIQTLMLAASFYVNFDSILMRDISAKVIKDFASDKSISLGKVINVFLENYKASDANVVIAANAFLSSCRFHRDVDSSMKHRLQAIAGKSH